MDMSRSDLKLNGMRAYSMCEDCYKDGRKIVTHGRETKVGSQARKRKGTARLENVDKGQDKDDDFEISSNESSDDEAKKSRPAKKKSATTTITGDNNTL